MNREIIFRAKQPHNGEWMEGYFSKDYAGAAYITTLDGVSTGIVDESTLGQFTGLTDKNGVKIWEGDIFTANEYPFIDDGEPNYNGVVEWIFAGFQYVLKLSNPEKIGISEGINEPLEDGGWLTVIGTIHDTHLTKQS